MNNIGKTTNLYRLVATRIHGIQVIPDSITPLLLGSWLLGSLTP
jgi:hypothetical protein